MRGKAAPRARRIARFPWTTDSNPYQTLLYSELAQRGYELAPDGDFRIGWLVRNHRRVGVLHFHWRLHRCFRRRHDAHGRAFELGEAARFVIRLIVARALGYRVLWTLHELYRHRELSPATERALGFALGRLAHVVFVHHDDIASRARSELGIQQHKLCVLPHPSYLDVYPTGVDRGPARRRLGLSDAGVVFLCFGSLRADKQLELLFEAFARLDDPRAALVVAGAPRGNADVIHRAARDDSRIRPLMLEIPTESVAELFGAADVFVAPRGDGWTSGSLVLALSMGLPVVAADQPAYADLLNGGEAGWLFARNDAGALAEALLLASRDAQARRGKALAARQLAHELPVFADLAASTCEAIAGAPRLVPHVSPRAVQWELARETQAA